MNRHTRGLLVAFLMLVGVALTFPSRAMAYDCNALVVDDAGALGSDISKVEAAAQKLESAGAYVRVRTVNDFGGFADVDRYEADYEAHCQAWQDMNGGTKSNLLVFAVSFGDQRGAGLYYGDLWKRALDAQWNTVLTEEVVPRLRDGDAPAAFVAGLNGINEIVVTAKAASRATTSTGTAPVVVVQQPSAPSQPTDFTGLWWVLALVVVGVGIAFAIRAVLAAMRRAEERREAQQKAKLAMQACVQHVVTAEEPLVLAEAKVGGQKGKFAESDLQPMRDTLAAARRAFMAAQTEYGELQGMDMNPDKNGLTTGQYNDLERRYNELLAKFRAATADVNGIDERIAALIALAAAANAEFDTAGEEVASDAYRVAAIKDAGFRVPQADATLESAFSALERAEGAKNAKAFDRVSGELADAKRLAKEAAEQAEAVRSGKAAIDAAIAAQRGEVERVDTRIDQAGEVFDDTSASYAKECWTIVAGNGSQAEQLIQDAEKALDAATTAAGMEQQDWAGAGAQLDLATGNTRRALALADAIIVLKRDLDAAKAAAPGEIEAAAADIAAARAFIGQHDADIDDGLETALDDAERSLATAREELAKDEPNYLTVVKVARAVNVTADGILDRARDEHAYMERLRQRAVTSMREAERSVDAANRYVENNRIDADDDAEQLSVTATHSLSRARGVPNSGEKDDLEEIVRLADQADKEADQALEMAQADVARRARERESALRELSLAEADIRAARDFIARHDADIAEGLETDLDEAERALAQSRQGLSQTRPDFLAVVRAAQAVNKSADAILEKAQDQHGAAERLRQRAASSLAEGERSVEAASRYISGRRSDVDSDAEQLAADAERSLASARGASSLEDRIRYGDQADQQADRALEMAKDDVRREERKREEAREAAERQARAIAQAAEAARRQKAAEDAARAAARAAASRPVHTPAPRGGGSVSIPSFGGGRGGGSVSTGGRGGRGGGSVGW